MIDVARLKVILQKTGLQNTNQSLFQLLNTLIDGVNLINSTITTISSSSTSTVTPKQFEAYISLKVL